jgi:DNA-binding protein HU-beta
MGPRRLCPVAPTPACDSVFFRLRRVRDARKALNSCVLRKVGRGFAACPEGHRNGRGEAHTRAKPWKSRHFSDDCLRKTLAKTRACAIFPGDSRVAALCRSCFPRIPPPFLSTQEYRNMAKKGGAPTKSEVLTLISKDTGLSRKQIGSVFDSLGGVIKKSLRGNKQFTFPGLLKMKVVDKPATKAREIPSPFAPGEMMTVKAKPRSKRVRVLPLKNLKAMVN